MHGLSIPKARTALETRLKISSFVAGFICLAFGITTSAQPQGSQTDSVHIPPASSESAPTETSVTDKLTLEQKVGQLMIWGFPGTELSPETRRMLVKYQPGALILFRRNVKTTLQAAKLNFELQKFAVGRLKAPLFIMVDQEGGLVTRIRSTTPMPSALALARMEDTAFVENYARATGEMLRLIGANVNLAPVLDISNPRKDSFIGNRTFGNEPETVSQMTMAYSRGLSSAGVIPTAKHFPGHGGTTQDSHQTTPRKQSTLEELNARDFVPFTEFASAPFVRAIMTAHLALPKVDASGVVATFSSEIIQNQLRANLGYEGLVITDDLEMAGAAAARDIGERAIRAFLAGNDMLMLAGSSANQRRAFEAIIGAVRSGRISKERLNESVARVLEAKSRLPAAPKLDVGKLLVALKKLDNLSKAVLKRNFKVAKAEAKSGWPEAKSETAVTIFSVSYMFFRKFEKQFKGKAKYFDMNPNSLENVRGALASSRADFAVFFASGSKSAQWLNGLSEDLKAKLIVINCNHPGEIENQDAFMSVFNVNSYFTDSGTWLAELLNQPIDMRTPAAEGEPTGDKTDLVPLAPAPDEQTPQTPDFQ